MRGRKRLRKKVFMKATKLPREYALRAFKLSDPMLRRRTRRAFCRSFRLAMEGFSEALRNLGITGAKAAKALKGFSPILVKAAGLTVKLERDMKITAHRGETVQIIPRGSERK